MSFAGQATQTPPTATPTQSQSQSRQTFTLQPSQGQTSVVNRPNVDETPSLDIPEHERRSSVWSAESYQRLLEQNQQQEPNGNAMMSVPRMSQAVLNQPDTSRNTAAGQGIAQTRYEENDWTRVTAPPIRQASAQGSELEPQRNPGSLPMPPLVAPIEAQPEPVSHNSQAQNETGPLVFASVTHESLETDSLRLTPATYDDASYEGASPRRTSPPAMLTRVAYQAETPVDVVAETAPGEMLEAESDGAKYSDTPMPKFYAKGEQKEESAENGGRGALGFLPKSTPPILTVLSSLAIVLGVFFILVWLMKRATPRQAGVLPQEVFEKLGSVPLSPKMHMHLFRLGGKLVLVSVTPDGMEPVAEVTDPDEVVHLIGLCKQNDPKSSSTAFRKVLKQYTGENGQQQQKPTPANYAAQPQYPQQPMPQQTQQYPPQNTQQMVRRPVGMATYQR